MSKLAKALTAAAGNAGESLYVEDVFSTYLYTGTSTSPNTITNGIDLDGEGGLVWLKTRTAGFSHTLFDTERGVNKTLYSDDTGAEGSGTSLTAFNSDGFTLGTTSILYNSSSYDYASWTFRKAEKFFDVVTYTGDGSGDRVISHSLNSTPASIIMKKTSAISDWPVYHTGAGTGAFEALALNQTSATGGVLNMVVGTSSSSFTVRSSFNDSGTTYVAYLFASDAGGFGDDGSESIIKCGSFSGSATNIEIDCGFEPQWILIKSATNTSDWYVVDVMRGMSVSDDTVCLSPNLSGAENTDPFSNIRAYPTATGFILPSGGSYWNTDPIYIAIRRPMKTPESGTEVFAIGQGDGDSDIPDYISNFPVDTAITKRTSAGNNGRMSSRLTGANYLSPNLTQAESADGAATFDFMNGWGSDGANRNTDEYAWMFKRATGFFDVVAYTGDGVAGRQIPHNLGAVPQLMITKARNSVELWRIGYTEGQIYTNWGSTGYAWTTNGNIYGDGTQWVDPTSSYVTAGLAINNSSKDYIQYLFGTLAGVSKVGSYTGNGTTQNIECGFSGGARFLMLWNQTNPTLTYVWDSERGIITGSPDPRLAINSTAAENTTNDALNTYAGGFGVTSSTVANRNGDTYIFLAIA